VKEKELWIEVLVEWKMCAAGVGWGIAIEDTERTDERRRMMKERKGVFD
jgi:hypothetical protein